MPVCDDCRQSYEGPAYYTIGAPEECWWEGEKPCTDNLCPTCAGPYLNPDNPNDPRRPEA